MKKFKYDAFISYRHVMPDELVAKTVHRQLENFKLPNNIKNKLLKEDPEARVKITRVFRDQEELPLASNLADPIIEALNDSEYLIVICSPRLKESIWCQKEIETFISLRGKENILAVLAEGEPEDSFPADLLTREITITDADGIARVINEKVEPLAADARGNNEKEVKKKLKTELLRLAAPIFKVSFDDLKQRHREQRMKRILGISIVCSLVFFTFGIVSSLMALKISSQNEEITRQNTEIKKQSEEITKQSDRINEQYQEALYNHGMAMADTSSILLEKGDRLEAVKTAYEVFPKGDNSEIPYVPEAEYSLNNALHSYDSGLNYSPERIIRASTNVNCLKLSPDCTKMVTCDISGEVSVWTPETGEKLWNYQIESGSLYDDYGLCFIDNEKLIFPDFTDVVCYDIEKDIELFRVEIFGEVRVVPVRDSSYALIYDSSRVFLYDSSKNKVIYNLKYDDENYTTLIDCSGADPNGKYFSYIYEMDRKKYLSLRNLKDGELIWNKPVSMDYSGFIKLLDDGIYLSSKEIREDDIMASNIYSRVNSYDYSGNLRWSFDIDACWLTNVLETDSSNGLIVAYGSEKVYSFNHNGKVMDSYNVGSQIINAYATHNGKNGLVSLLTRDGSWISLVLDSSSLVESSLFSECNSNNVRQFLIGYKDDPYVVTLPYSSNEITIYKNIKSPYFEPIQGDAVYIIDSVVSDDGNYAAGISLKAGGEHTVEVYDLNKKVLIGSIDLDDTIRGLFFDENKLICLNAFAIKIIDIPSMSVINKTDVESSGALYGYNAEIDRMYFNDNTGVKYYDYNTGKMSFVIESNRPVCSHNGKIFVTSDKDGKKYEIRCFNIDEIESDIKLMDLPVVDTIDEKFTYVKDVFFDNNDEYIFVAYYDNTFDILKINPDGSIDRSVEKVTCDKLNDQLISVSYDKNTGYGVLYTQYYGYIFTAEDDKLTNLNITAKCYGLLRGKNLSKLVISNRANLYLSHILSHEDLLKLAKETLGE